MFLTVLSSFRLFLKFAKRSFVFWYFELSSSSSSEGISILMRTLVGIFDLALGRIGSTEEGRTEEFFEILWVSLEAWVETRFWILKRARNELEEGILVVAGAGILEIVVFPLVGSLGVGVYGGGWIGEDDMRPTLTVNYYMSQM